MKIKYQSNEYTDKRQALCEFAFCHFPLTIQIDDETMTFDCFSSLESFILSY